MAWRMDVSRSLTLKFSVTVGASALSPGFACFKVVFQPYGVADGRFAFVNAEIQRYGGCFGAFPKIRLL
ncbi:hypothetical protein GCM10008018_31760 [Paenibacillus marchantiophytorum]|uniref:Uncharacterized protein n=1 Tax=Paenibacillus marchantiophytorum TaxID=1619310 RepID=A0ABQ1EQZ0_9BACL|nr:hypothetical protein GCM10008018_31760 [Paenibacillus marchantiophytorum]